jgi:hypothetical protein
MFIKKTFKYSVRQKKRAFFENYSVFLIPANADFRSVLKLSS